MALESMLGCDVPLMVPVWSILGQTVENAAVRWSRVFASIVPACPIGMATNSTLPQYCPRAATRGKYFSVLSVCFTVASEVPGKPNFYEVEGAFLLSKLVWPGSGVSGTHLAYMGPGAVPWLPSKRVCVSSAGNIHVGIRLGVIVHSAS